MSRRSVRLTEADNGYIVAFDGLAGPGTEVFRSLEEVFTRLLSYFEWRNEGGEGKEYGKVRIERGKTDARRDP